MAVRHGARQDELLGGHDRAREAPERGRSSPQSAGVDKAPPVLTQPRGPREDRMNDGTDDNRAGCGVRDRCSNPHSARAGSSCPAAARRRDPQHGTPSRR
jgi:hypothetical protein